MVPPRTNPGLVQAVFSSGGMEYDGITNLSPYVAMASATVDRVKAMAALKGLPLGLSDFGVGSDCELMERWLSAHFYVTTDRSYASRSTQGASGSFMSGTPEKGFASTEYGRNAVACDYSGCLENLGKKQRARLTWLGKPPSAQIPFWERS